MSLGVNIEFKELNSCDCKSDLLKDFKRYQEVNRCWRKIDNEWVLKDIHFIEQWDDAQKENKISSFLWCIQNNGHVFGAFKGNRLIGFATIDSVFWGCKKEYIQLEMLHVSYDYRNKGIGKRLFSVICSKAKQNGARKLYISAHSSEESQAFYRSAGCIEAVEINKILAENEPYDCQLEYIL
jgi:GNAT superfamily N-acetyltransferase